ncbi:hypothetical protein [Mucilaginibacter sp. PAMB04168]|uniref:hypothetical protein n=1 Tax=Mucilaginibacter sp. PAMB04168 TaxID=3138567 RepID=UPI0031F7126E
MSGRRIALTVATAWLRAHIVAEHRLFQVFFRSLPFDPAMVAPKEQCPYGKDYAVTWPWVSLTQGTP